jgi:rhodanese-related sulfurtransferase
MKKFLLLLTLVSTLCFGADAYEDDVSADEAYEMQKKGEAIIVDVRTTLEYLYTGHGEGFINIPAFIWTYDPKSLDARVKSADYEIKNSMVKDHVASQKLYNAKEVMNKTFVEDVMKAMKMKNVSKVVLVCRSGPRSKAAANLLAKQGIEAYNLEDGFIFGWQEEKMPWGGQ